MDIYNPEMLKKYIGKSIYPSVSLYMPSFRKGEEVEQNHIRYKNLLRGAERKLTDAGIKPDDAEELLKPAAALVDDINFWNYQDNGLAVFISPDEFFYYTSPDSFTENVVLSDKFYLRPFLSMLNSNERFLIIALNQKSIRLFEGNRFYLNEIPLKGVMISIEDYFATEENDTAYQMYSQGGRAASPGSGGGTYHMQGDSYDDTEKKEKIRQFFNLTDKGMQKYLNTEKAPLLLAGIEYLLPIFRETSSYQYVLEDTLPLNTYEFSNNELHSAAWDIIKKRIDKNLDDAFMLYSNYSGTKRAVDNVVEIVRNLYSNRIFYLFINPAAHIWGKFDRNTFRIEIHNEYEKGDIDLIDLAAEQTLLHNGIVFSVNAGRLPEGKQMAALFRY